MHSSRDTTQTLLNVLVIGAYRRVLESAGRKSASRGCAHSIANARVHISPLEHDLWQHLGEVPTPSTANNGTLEARWDACLEKLAGAFLQVLVLGRSSVEPVMISKDDLHDRCRYMVGFADLFVRFGIAIGYASTALAQMSELLLMTVEGAGTLDVRIGDRDFRLQIDVPSVC